MENRLEFFCYENDPTLSVQLEPQGFNFEVKPGELLVFIAIDTKPEFRWSIRANERSEGLQLFPDSPKEYTNIEVYLNDQQVY